MARDVEEQLRTALGTVAARVPRIQGADLDAAVDRRRTARRRARRLRAAGALVTVAAVVGATVAAVTSDDEPARRPVDVGPGTTVPGEPAVGTWHEIAPSPLSPRQGAVGVWTGEEVLVVGGTDTDIACTDTADCPSSVLLADAAAYDPAADMWRPIAPLPEPLVAARSALWANGEMIVLAESADGALELLGYDPAADAWTSRTPPPSEVSAGTVVDHRIVYWRAGDGVTGGWLYDVSDDAWSELPAWPWAAASDVQFVWTGRELVMVGRLRAGEGAPTLNHAAILDLRQGTWRDLPTSDVVGCCNWTAANGLVLNAQVGAFDGPVLDPEDDRSYRNGGILDPRQGTWRRLPQPSRELIAAASDGETFAATVAVDGRVALAGTGLLFHPASGTWSAAPDGPHPGQPDLTVALDDGIFVWGGYAHAPWSQELTNAGAVFRLAEPPPASAPSTTDAAASTTTSMPVTTAAPPPPTTATTLPPTTTEPLPSLPTRPLEPGEALVATRSGILGWWDGAAWIPASSASTLEPTTPIPAEPGVVYRLVRLDDPITTAAGSAPTAACHNGSPGIEIPGLFSRPAAPPPGPQVLVPDPVAVSGTHDPRPRPVEVFSDPYEYRATVLGALAQLGVSDLDPRVAQVVHADLDGNGTDEAITIGETGPPSYVEIAPDGGVISTSPAAGDATVVVVSRQVDQHVETQLLESYVAEGGVYMPYYRVAAAADLNGDGRMELVLQHDYYEGGGFVVYELDAAGALHPVLEGGCGF